jgi:thiamine-monophosphate kinase
MAGAQHGSAQKGSPEDRLIARFFKPLATEPGALGLTDDAAFLRPPPGCDLVLTTDAVVSGVHFFPDDPAFDVARRALRVNLSDLAAKGARPLGYLLTLALPANVSDDWLAAAADGLRQDAEEFSCPLYGGDTDRTPGPLSLTVAMFGAVPEGTMVRRSGATPGDRVFVSGTIGDASLGVLMRKQRLDWNLAPQQREYLLGRYLLPRPRVALAEALRLHASAAMDVSDGLVGDLGKLCRVSGVTAHIDVARMPLSEAAQAAHQADAALIELILTGGDDYEIVCTVPPAKVAGFQSAAAAAGIVVSDIGSIAAGEGAQFCDDNGKPMRFARAAYSHF